MLEVTFLAILQGIAEFLPISSSGHLVIGQHLLGMQGPGLRLDVMLHVGTLISIVVFYWRTIVGLLGGMFRPSAPRDVRAGAWAYLGKVLVSALPAVIVYFLFHDFINGMFENAKMVGALLMFTGAILIGTRYIPRGENEVSWRRALLMGLGQALALLPGVSRSGMTLATARGGKVDTAKSAEFSFLMSAPLILGAAGLQVLESLRAVEGSESATAASQISWPLAVYGAVFSAIIGYFSLKLLVRTLKGQWFWLFGTYCLAAGLLTLILIQ
jgi:undecaprenyl-diphosphatase